MLVLQKCWIFVIFPNRKHNIIWDIREYQIQFQHRTTSRICKSELISADTHIFHRYYMVPHLITSKLNLSFMPYLNFLSCGTIVHIERRDEDIRDCCSMHTWSALASVVIIFVIFPDGNCFRSSSVNLTDLRNMAATLTHEKMTFIKPTLKTSKYRLWCNPLYNLKIEKNTAQYLWAIKFTNYVHNV